MWYPNVNNCITLQYDIIVRYYYIYTMSYQEVITHVCQETVALAVSTIRQATRRRRWLPQRPLFQLKDGRRSFRSSLSDVSCPVRQ